MSGSRQDRAEFFVRGLPDNDDIINAARSLGDRTAHDETIKALIEDKLVSALRTVAATRTLEDLNSKRDEFVRQVMDFVTADLKHNGFTLETATISALDQADAAIGQVQRLRRRDRQGQQPGDVRAELAEDDGAEVQDVAPELRQHTLGVVRPVTGATDYGRCQKSFPIRTLKRAEARAPGARHSCRFTVRRP